MPVCKETHSLLGSEKTHDQAAQPDASSWARGRSLVNGSDQDPVGHGYRGLGRGLAGAGSGNAVALRPREEPVAKGLTPSSGSTQPDTHSVASQRSVGVPPHPEVREAPGSTQREMGPALKGPGLHPDCFLGYLQHRPPPGPIYTGSCCSGKEPRSGCPWCLDF